MCDDDNVPLSSGQEDQVRLADHTFGSGSSGICGLPFRRSIVAVPQTSFVAPLQIDANHVALTYGARLTGVVTRR
jgi:hypothetical protein